MKYSTTRISYLLIAAVIGIGVFGYFVPSRATVNPQVAAYLASVSPQTDWSIMARAALGADISDADALFLKTVDGDTANDYATYILAIVALGEDPRSFGSKNLVYELRQKASSGQIGDVNLLSDDMFGLLALRAAGVSTSDALTSQTASYLKTKQLSDGGWDWSAGSTNSSVDYTAMAIMALVAAGVPASDNALLDAADYLIMAQNDDGGFPIAPGLGSNAASTAWVISAFHAMGDDPNFFAPGGKTPGNYLNARLHESGYFLFNAQSASLDQFTPIATSYAAIALSGKAYPTAFISAPPTASLRIEGQSETICDTQATGRTALDVIKSSAGQCGYTYVIEDTQFGLYLSAIAGEAADPVTFDGWSYLPNYELAQVGASSYQMAEGDELIWYYGAWNDKPLRVVHDQATVAAGDTTTAVVQEYADGLWSPYAGATLSRGNETFTSNANGQVSLSWSQNGTYYLVAIAAGHVRSDAVLVVSGEAGEQASMPLSVSITTEAGSGPSSPALEPGGVSFGASGDLSFGTLAPGASATRQATLTNGSISGITATASITGSSFFSGNITLDAVAPAQWQKGIAPSASDSVDVTLRVPSPYSGSGSESGTLIFWAHNAN